MSEIRSRLLNSVRATSFAVTIACRHAATVRSTSLKRASMSSVSLYLSTVIPVRESVESTRHHPDRQAFGVTLPYTQLHTSCESTTRFLQTCDTCVVLSPRVRGRVKRVGLCPRVGSPERGS